MAKEFIADGAFCKCTFGTTPGQILVTDQQFSRLNGDKLCATTQTLGPKAVKPPFFGSCKASYPTRPCSPSLTQWSRFFTKLQIGINSFPLTDDSMGLCACGGNVMFSDTGQIPVLGPGQLSHACAECQGELDPAGDPMALEEHQVTALSEISTGEEQPAETEGKVISAGWVNAEDKTITAIEYKQTAYLLVKTEGITDEVKVKIVEIPGKVKIQDVTEWKKVAEWDEAKEGDTEFSVKITDNTGKVEFKPDDTWLSKRSLAKRVTFQVYYKDKEQEVRKQQLNVNMINYNKDMRVSDTGVRFTAQEEAVAMICPDGKVRAYLDTKNNWTIGYGEMTGITADTVLDSKEVAWDRYKEKIKGSFDAQARNLLKKQGVKFKLEQYQYDALVDLVYNAWSCDSLVGEIADGEEVTEQMFLEFRGDGLQDRRKKQYKLYTNQITSVTGPVEFHRKDNTNKGYEKIPKMKKSLDANGKPILDAQGNFVMEEEKNAQGETVMEPGHYAVKSKDVYTVTY